MRLNETFCCLVHGHAFRKITHSGSVYSYCSRCGRIVWHRSHLKTAISGAELHGLQQQVISTVDGVLSLDPVGIAARYKTEEYVREAEGHRFVRLAENYGITARGGAGKW